MRKVWFWALFVIIVAADILSFAFRDSLAQDWSDNEKNIMLPIVQISVLIVLLIVWGVPKLYVSNLKDISFNQKKEKLRIENESRQTLAQIIGGIIILGGLFFTYSTYRLNTKQLELGTNQQKLNEEGQITDRFTKAVELIGSQEVEVRTAGLYALERISKDSQKDYWTIMEIVSAFVREKSHNFGVVNQASDSGQRSQSTSSKNRQRENVASDIKAALTILGTRNGLDPVGKKINLKKANLQNIDLSDLNFSNTDFSDADLSDAILSETKLINAVLVGTTLKGAMISDNTDLTGADLSSADLRGASLSGVKVTELKFEDTDFRGTDLHEINELKYEQLTVALVDTDTKLPEYLKNRQAELIGLTRRRLVNLGIR
jgi:hypothetical protein